MLHRLRYSYRELLAQSLQGAAWLELGLAHKPDAVWNATTLLLRQSSQPDRLLPPGTSIVQVYEEANHELLILGEPGVGKSTLLLQLAQHLVEQAEQDAARLLPVILPLSSWAVKRPLIQDWLGEQLSLIYDVPRQISREWVHQEQVLPLLDGLDEVEESARAACIAAINAYHREHLLPLVVCSRVAEYESATVSEQLVLHSAAAVQLLTQEQIDASLIQAGKPLKALRSALRRNPTLRELASTPLMLSVLMLTYQGTSVRSLPQKEAELLRQVWTDYVRQMVERKGDVVRYPLEPTRSWLHWLAHQMWEHNQAVFYLEHLQPDWLPARLQHVYSWLAVRVPGMLIGVLASLTITLFLSGYQGPASLLQSGVLGGFLGGLFSAVAREGSGLQRVRSCPRLATRHVIIIIASVLVGLMYGLSFGTNLDPYYGPGDWLRDGSSSSVLIGLSCWLLLFLLPRFSSRESQSSAPDLARRWLGLRRMICTWHGQRALLIAVVLGGGSGLSRGLSVVLSVGLKLSVGLLFGLSKGLLFGLTSVLVNLIFAVQTGDVHLTERLRWTWRSLIRSLLTSEHLRTTGLFASIVFVLVGLSFGLSFGLSVELSYGLSYGLSFGLSYGLSVGLSYWLLLGLFQGISYERVEDQDRRIFNQGIQRSFRTSWIIGVISGAVIGAVGVLSNRLSIAGGVRLSHGLPIGLFIDPGFGLSVGLQAGLLLAISSCLLVCAISGGLAVLRHAVLRLLLWRTHTFPWQAAPFLEDATARILLRRVGSGYSFVHRLLLDYFTDLDAGTPSALAGVQTNTTPGQTKVGSDTTLPRRNY